MALGGSRRSEPADKIARLGVLMAV